MGLGGGGGDGDGAQAGGTTGESRAGGRRRCLVYSEVRGERERLSEV
jgi:hypothetical protein